MADTPRTRALRLLSQGHTIAEVARRVGMSHRTVQRWKVQAQEQEPVAVRQPASPHLSPDETPVLVLIRREGNRLIATVADRESDAPAPAPALRPSVTRPQPGDTIEHEYAPGELDGVSAMRTK